MSRAACIKVEYLRRLVEYDPETGDMLWRERGPEWFQPGPRRSAEHACRNWNSRYAGTKAFNVAHGNGYRRGRLAGRDYYAHRVAWAVFTGSWPEHEIDHVNGKKADNRIVNLRDATAYQNQQNKEAPSSNTSGIKGVSWVKPARKWQVNISANGERRYLGMYSDAEAASAAYAAAARELHGEFARLDG